MLTGISVIVCTRNPRRDVFDKTLSAIAAQVGELTIELILVDNGSDPPLTENDLRAAASLTPTLHSEPRSGLFFARQTGFRLASQELIVLVDDDNELSCDYLKIAAQIADREPYLGAFGGRSRYVGQRKPSKFERHFLPYLGIKDEGDEPLTGSGDKWGPHEPIGAGMVIRRSVADAYVSFVAAFEDPVLGRVGRDLLSGEDSLTVRIAHTLGFRVGYRPHLKLDHRIDERRLRLRYMARLLRGHGRSYVRLGRICGESFPDRPSMLMERVAKFLYLSRCHSFAHAVADFYWTIGYEEECALVETNIPQLNLAGSSASSLPT